MSCGGNTAADRMKQMHGQRSRQLPRSLAILNGLLTIVLVGFVMLVAQPRAAILMVGSFLALALSTASALVALYFARRSKGDRLPEFEAFDWAVLVSVVSFVTALVPLTLIIVQSLS